MDNRKIPYKEENLYPLFFALDNGVWYYYFLQDYKFCWIDLKTGKNFEKLNQIKTMSETSLISCYNINARNHTFVWINNLLILEESK